VRRDNIPLIEVWLGVGTVSLPEGRKHDGVGGRKPPCRLSQCVRVLRGDEHPAVRFTKQPSRLMTGFTAASTGRPAAMFVSSLDGIAVSFAAESWLRSSTSAAANISARVSSS
jgi:hypothetical protein